MDNAGKPKHDFNLLSWATILPVVTAYFYYLGKTYDDGYYKTLGIDVTLLNFSFEHYLTTMGIMTLVFYFTILLIYLNYKNEVSKSRGYFLSNYLLLVLILLILFYIFNWGKTDFYSLSEFSTRNLYFIGISAILAFVTYKISYHKISIPLERIFNNKVFKYLLLLMLSILFILLAFGKGQVKAEYFKNNQEAFYTIINFKFKNSIDDNHKSYVYILYNNDRYFVYDTVPNPQKLFVFHEDLIESISLEKRSPENTN